MTRARDVANLIGSGNYSSTTFTATAGQTAFSISHTQGFVQVFMNGLLLDETVDYTSNGSAVTLTSGAAAGDEIEVVAYNTFSVGDALPKSGGAMTGDLTVDTNTFHVDVADNKVGIGTTAPTNLLTIIDGGATPYGADATLLLDIKRNTANTGATNAVGIRLANNSNGFNIKYGGTADKLDIVGGSGDTVATFNNQGGVSLPYGVYLGGTGTANHLEDYEEGTWTPAFQNGGTLSVLSARYTKVGNLVSAQWYVNISNVPNDTAQVLLTGLPFAVSANSNNYHGVSGMPSYVGSANWNNYDFGGATPWTNNTKLYWHYLGGSSGVVTNNNWHFLNGNALIMGIMYLTDA